MIGAALRALAERGQWIGPADLVPELFRAGLRRAGRRVGIQLRTGIEAHGRVWAATSDGLPAHEPWRGAATHALEPGVEETVAMRGLEQLIRGSLPPPERRVGSRFAPGPLPLAAAPAGDRPEWKNLRNARSGGRLKQD